MCTCIKVFTCDKCLLSTLEELTCVCECKQPRSCCDCVNVCVHTVVPVPLYVELPTKGRFPPSPRSVYPGPPRRALGSSCMLGRLHTGVRCRKGHPSSWGAGCPGPQVEGTGGSEMGACEIQSKGFKGSTVEGDWDLSPHPSTVTCCNQEAQGPTWLGCSAHGSPC